LLGRETERERERERARKREVFLYSDRASCVNRKHGFLTGPNTFIVNVNKEGVKGISRGGREDALVGEICQVLRH
jgi:hypothetical protein